MIDVLRCNGCRRVYERSYINGKPGCAKCGRRRFDNAGRLTLWEEISLILRNPSLVKAIFKGESVNV